MTNMDNENFITIGKKKYKYREEDVMQNMLKFYPENPRVYSLLVIDGVVPDQKEIEEKLTDMEHVRCLRQSIEANGGLIDPLIVRDGDNVVLEGNSRLAAYRILAKRDPTKWSLVRCKILPASITDDAVFQLLGQYHIVGRQDWNPFEQAGYLWRRVNNNEIAPELLSKELGLSESKTKKMIEVYGFMIKHDAVDKQKWSYYEEYLKSRSIKKSRLEIPELDEAIVDQIKKGEINQAIDIRQKLEPVTKIHSNKKRKKLIQSLIFGEHSLDECFEIAKLNGVNTDILQDLKKIRNKLNAIDIKKHITSISEEDKKRCHFEVKKILQRSKEIEKKFNIN